MPELLEPADPRGLDREVSVLAPTTARAAPPPRLQPALAPPVLLFERVSKWYGPVIGVNQVTLELRPGITGLVGHNGAGKSTLLRLAGGHIRPDLGTVAVAGVPTWSAEAKVHIGYCPDVDRFYEEMSGRQFLQVMAQLCGYPRRAALQRTEATLELVGMQDRADRKLQGYSKGMRQRIKLAQALLHDPELLLLDEPLSGIDPVGRREMLALFQRLAELGKCLLISSHELEELEKMTDQVAIMARGRICAVGTLTHIRDLLEQHPLSILLDSDQNRRLARLLLDSPEVLGVDFAADGRLVVRAQHASKLFEQLTEIILTEDIEMRHMETLDDSLHAILEYLLK